MLLVSFHGGKPKDTPAAPGTSSPPVPPINNLYWYSDDGTLVTTTALDVHHYDDVKLDEIRGIAIYGGNLYVVNGDKKQSCVLAFNGPPKNGSFKFLNTVIGGGQSIAHPFEIAFVITPASTTPLPTVCYVSNQDSNVVAEVSLSAGAGCQVMGSMAKGSASIFLNGKYPPAAFLDGTFVASQFGNLAGVDRVAPSVPGSDGGLGLLPAPPSQPPPIAPSNSVRGVAIASDILFVCDEVDEQINMYRLADGAYLGSGSLAGAKPTHVTVDRTGLWVSAGASLAWSALPSSSNGASLAFQAVSIGVPANNKIGGLAFDDAGNVYVIFQDGTHAQGTGTIQKFVLGAGPPPTLSHPALFATIKEDTPEFCLWASDSHWPG